MSSVLKEFAKIGRENGWIKRAEEKKDKLYDLKIDDKNILEQAHPENPMVVLRTHVPLNGMVHNLQQKQDINVDVASRTPLGNYQQNFYIQAYQNLMEETIKVAYYLDNQNEESLTKLADACSQQLHKKAAWPLVALVIAGVAALYGGLYSSNNPSSQGIKQDAQRALEKIKEITEDDLQSGQTLEPLQNSLNKLLQSASSFYEYNDQILSTMLQVTGTNSVEDKKKAIALNVKELLDGTKHDKIVSDFNFFKDICLEVSRQIPIAKQYLLSAEQQHHEAENSTWYQIKKIIRDYVYNSDYQDLVKILDNLLEDISQVPANIDQQLTRLNDLKQKTESLPNDIKEILSPNQNAA